ncbi:heme/copper-type cytochrome/quinol oxidase subunit 2 [Lysobacter niastensis]|uniref:Heme/copper-type cytochrome/quinol oxidase subunit 2 n=1 Tax=Lysobacter niastensis TaxID=380629 RepID=A0ABU1W8Z1_9GAMM|nr:hypothetical protein [Lysobacter niastensis]MDR7134052.1 heme/copper-type cytochrome/quinol oxidase subunit 2 [Lysobacter niastensis]
MKTIFKLAAWILANVATVPLVFFASLSYWTSIVQEEYRTGVRVSTDGDTVMIPAIEYTVAWAMLLIAINLLVAVILAVRFYRRRPNNSFKPKPLRGSA